MHANSNICVRTSHTSSEGIGTTDDISVSTGYNQSENDTNSKGSTGTENGPPNSLLSRNYFFKNDMMKDTIWL